MHLIQSFFISLLLIGSLHTMGQSKEFSQWTAFFSSYKINRVIGIHFDAHVRTDDQVKHVGTIILRPGIHFTLRKDLFATIGYALVENRRTIGDVSGYVPEQRIWQQMQLSHPAFFTTLTHRLRYEQRFISRYFLQNNEIHYDGHDFATRVRYFLRDMIPFNGEKSFKKGFFASIQNEIFINTGNKKSVNGKYFDQNRFLLGLGRRFSKKFDLEAAYMNRYISGKNTSFTNNHIFHIATYLRL